MLRFPTAANIFVVCAVVFSISLIATSATAQRQSALAGAPAGSVFQPAPMAHPGTARLSKVNGTVRGQSTQYTTTTFTFGDITVFSYFDGTDVIILNSAGDTVGNASMRADTLYSISPGQGIYTIEGNKTFSVLIGDAITNYINGYFALDESGRGVSTKFNTWMMFEGGYDPHFIIFAYEDGTQYTIKNLKTGSFVYAGSLDNGQYLDFPDIASIQQQALQVTANKPVSVLSYTDQDYYVPSSNGRFAGTLFYGFSGYSGSWENSITVTSYTDNNHVLITNLATGDTIANDTLGLWQVKSIGIFKDTVWKVASSGTVTAANIPFAGWSGGYAYMARSADSTGTNTGKTYVIPSISSTISIFSYDNNNQVKITLLGDTTYPYISPTSVTDTLLQAGQGYIFSSNYGNYVYRIEGTGRISVLQSNSGFGADFMPLGYALALPDLAVSQSDINFTPPDSVFHSGDKIQIGVTVHNYGTIDASNVLVQLYDGNPDAGLAPPIGSYVAPLISAGGQFSKTIQYVVPVNAQYHNVYVKVDPSNSLAESNESNNMAFRPLKANRDLLPPLSTYITAPAARTLEDSTLAMNPFIVHADIFNTGTVSATNVTIHLFVYNGLAIDSGFVDTTISSLAADSVLSLNWKILANKDSSGLNLYTLHLSGDNVETKDINRAVLIPDTVAPATPTGLSAHLISLTQVRLTWTPNAERDMAGYKIYYSSGLSGFGGTEAAEGPSPIVVSSIDTMTLSGLTRGRVYRFAISAFDLSVNESALSNVVTESTTDVSQTSSSIPSKYSLAQNYPNPFNPTTSIQFDLPRAGLTTVKVYDLLGKEVAMLVHETKAAGSYSVSWNAQNMPSGMYFVRLNSGGFTQTRKMMLIK